MRLTKATVLVTGLFLLSTCGALCQECDSLQKTTPEEMASYISRAAPNWNNPECITWAIDELGRQRYEPAVSALTWLLDFRRPPIGREKEGLYLHAQGIWEIYPAANALALIGKIALPAMLNVIKAEVSSATMRENATFVWMQVYKTDSPLGVALLKQESDRAFDPVAKQKLQWAVSQALGWCNPPEEARCKAAAKTGLPQ